MLCRPPPSVSTCELEADACAEDILNRGERLRVPLEVAPPEARLVESLGLMWEEERQRCGCADPPPPPPDPPRSPAALCAAVDYVRAQFQVRNGNVHLPNLRSLRFMPEILCEKVHGVSQGFRLEVVLASARCTST